MPTSGLQVRFSVDTLRLVYPLRRPIRRVYIGMDVTHRSGLGVAEHLGHELTSWAYASGTSNLIRRAG